MFDLEVYAKYESFDEEGTSTNLNALITALTSAFSLNPSGGTGLDGQGAYNAFNGYFGAGALVDPNDIDDDEPPRAFLNYILFDENFGLVDFGFDQVSNDAEQVGVSPNVLHDYLSLHLQVKQKGYLYIYVSNEHPVMANVYFDDFKITRHTAIEQSDDYYAFGLAFNSYQRENSTPNQYLYNKGSERQEELDLNVYQTHYRFLDPAIGRWWQVDPKASATYDMSVYSSMNNNPIRYNDPLGDVVEIEHRRGFLGLGKKETLTYNNGALTKADGSAYTGKVKGFLGKAVNALNGVAAGSATGARLLGEAQSSTNTFKIVKTSGDNKFEASNTMAANAKAINVTNPGLAPTGGSGGTVRWNPNGGKVMETGGNYTTSSDTNLAHELLGHGIDANRGEADNTVVNGLKRDEWQATSVENTIRGEMGRPLREYYRVQDSGGVMSGLPPLMVVGGVPVPPPTMANGATYIRP